MSHTSRQDFKYMFVFLLYCFSVLNYCMSQVLNHFTFKFQICYWWFSCKFLYQMKMFNSLVIPTNGKNIQINLKDQKVLYLHQQILQIKDPFLKLKYQSLHNLDLLLASNDIYHRCFSPCSYPAHPNVILL